MVMAPEDQLLCGSEAKLKKKNIATGHLMENTYWSQIESSFTQSGDFEGFQIFQDITWCSEVIQGFYSWYIKTQTHFL